MLPLTHPQSGSPVAAATAPTLESLTSSDRDRLSLLFRTRGDAVSFATLREEDPLETLVWLAQPHIKPWHELIQATHRVHEQTETRLALARALKDITRILDLEADSTLRIRAVNAIIRLANAIHRAGAHPSVATPPIPAAASYPLPAEGRAGVGLARNQKPTTTARAQKELHRATDNAEAAALHLKFHLDRRALRDDALQDAKAPRGTPPTPLPNPPPDRIAGLDRTTDTPPITLLSPTRPGARPTHLNGKHNNSAHALTARAGTPRPPPRRKRKHHR